MCPGEAVTLDMANAVLPVHPVCLVLVVYHSTAIKMSSDRTGKVQTVLGLVNPEDLGQVLPHEHLFQDISYLCQEPDLSPDDADKPDIPITMDNLWWIRQHPYSHKLNNNTLDEYDTIANELRFLKQNGGSTIVDNTVYGQQRNIQKLVRVSKDTGIQIVSGTGFYVEQSDAPRLKDGTVEELTQILVDDILVGADGTDAKCGLIGEVGCSWPLRDCEKKSLRASGEAHCLTGCPIMIHPGRSTEAPGEILRILQEVGCDLTKVTMGHLDRTFHDGDQFLEFAAETTCYLEYDIFGVELSYYPFAAEFDFPSDATRIQWVKQLVDGGFGDRILISMDAGQRTRLMKYGGHGYSHIYRNVVPKMRLKGISDDAITKICSTNPQKFLTFK